MQGSSLTSLACPHKPAPLRGSLGDLVTRAQGRPIYCTPSFAVRRALMNVIVGSLRREFPAAVFVHALTIYRNHNDWSRRWYSEHERYGAGILVTRAEDLPEGTDPLAGLAGEHVIGSRVGIEIQTLVRQGRPVAWHRRRVPRHLLVIPLRNSAIQLHFHVPLRGSFASPHRRALSSRNRPVFLPRCAGLRWPAPNPLLPMKAAPSSSKSSNCANAATRSARSPDAQGSRNRTFMTSRPVSAACHQRAQPPQRSISPESGLLSRLSTDSFAPSIR